MGVDITTIILTCFVIFIIISICVSCCKRNKEGTVYGVAQGSAVPPYPVADSSMPQPSMPQPSMPQPSGYNMYPAGGSYPTSNYPTAQIYMPPAQNYPSGTPYPPPSVPLGYPPIPLMGGYPNSTPYPPMQYPAQAAPEQQPPSYAEAVTQPPTRDVYAKQAPYNPNF